SAADRHAGQRRAADIVWHAVEARVASEDDQIANAIAPHDGMRFDADRLPCDVDTMSPVRADLDAARCFRLEIRVRESREIEIVERRRLERGSGGRGDPPFGFDSIAVRDSAGR